MVAIIISHEMIRSILAPNYPFLTEKRPSINFPPDKNIFYLAVWHCLWCVAFHGGGFGGGGVSLC